MYPVVQVHSTYTCTTYHGTKVKIFKTQSGRAVREVKSKRGGRGWMRGKCQVVGGVQETGAGGEIGRIEEYHVVILFYTL